MGEDTQQTQTQAIFDGLTDVDDDILSGYDEQVLGLKTAATHTSGVGLTLAITAVARLGDREDRHAGIAGITDLVLEGEQVLGGDDAPSSPRSMKES